jgi:hypothetical protein
MSTRYLKNAWVRKDEEGDYWLNIESGDLRAMFCLSECMDLDADENSVIRCALEAWVADQDSTNGETLTTN